MKILLVDDHTLFRKGLAEVLRATIEDATVTEAATAEEAVALLQEEPHDVALVDIRMPSRDGIALLRDIRAAWPDLPVIMITGYERTDYVKNALSEGAAGYLLKDATPDDLVQAIHVARSGSGSVLSPRAIRTLFEEPTGPAEPARGRLSGAGLTRREEDVLELLAQGFSNREISKRLFLSEKTIKAHLAAVFRKLGVANRTQAAMTALSLGIGSRERRGPVTADGTPGASGSAPDRSRDEGSWPGSTGTGW